MRLAKPLLGLMLLLLLLPPQVRAKKEGSPLSVSRNQVKHVLLISVDGLHALDLAGSSGFVQLIFTRRVLIGVGVLAHGLGQDLV
jgi:hypothetical protein